jgi:DNA replication protein DnaC
VPVQTCPHCHGVGWKIVENDGISGAQKCDCRDEELDRHRREHSRIPPNYRDASFDNFSCTHVHQPELQSQLRDVMLMVRTYANNMDPKRPGLLLVGRPGSGKTHLAVAALKILIARGFDGMFYNYQELLNKIIVSYRPEAGSGEREAYRDALEAEVLLLDDLGANRVNEWVQDTITSIITHRCDNRKPLIATTNLPDVDAGDVLGKRSQDGTVDYRRTLADHIGERARSRLFEMCRVIKLPWVDDYRIRTRNQR